MAALDLLDDVVADMPPDARDAFFVYMATTAKGGQRSLVKTAQLTGIPGGTIRSWAYRFEWADRSLKFDVENGRASLTACLVAAASLRPQIIETLERIAFEDPLVKQVDRLQAIKQLREMAGLTGPMLERALMVGDGSDEPQDELVSNDQLQAMVDRGDTDGLMGILRSQ